MILTLACRPKLILYTEACNKAKSLIKLQLQHAIYGCVINSSTFFPAGFRLTDHRVDHLLQTLIVDIVLSPLRRKMRREGLCESHFQNDQGPDALTLDLTISDTPPIT